MMCGGLWIRMVDRDLIEICQIRHPVEKNRNITRVIILVIILVITVDLSFYHILSYSIIFYHILSYSIIPDSSLPDHSSTPVAIDLLYLLVFKKPGADRIHLQSVSARLRNNHVAGFSNMFYIVLPSKRKQLPFLNGSWIVHGVYIYI